MKYFAISIVIFVSATFLMIYFASVVLGSTNISSDSSSHWAWNDIVGWINFFETNTVTVTSQQLTGYASSSAGDISLDCATTRSGDICSQSDYKVTNDGSGNLSGWAWNDTYGWISFWCGNNDGCGTSGYRVAIDSGGDFQNYAWSDAIGWISFNCVNTSSCGSSNYKVATTWVATSTNGTLDSEIFDSGESDGVKLNSVFWRGSQPANTEVKFQFAMSNATSGPWSYIGPDGTEDTSYSAQVDVVTTLEHSLHNNFRYFRYRITLVSNQAQTATPRVDEVIIRWSP